MGVHSMVICFDADYYENDHMKRMRAEKLNEMLEVAQKEAGGCIIERFVYVPQIDALCGEVRKTHLLGDPVKSVMMEFGPCFYYDDSSCPSSLSMVS